MLRSRRMPVLVTVLAVLTLTVTALAVTAAASGAGAPKPNPAVQIGTAKIPKLGTVLVNGAGRVLYMFEPDDHAKVVCSRTCQKVWPPVVAPKSGVAHARYGAKQSLIGSDRNPADGKRIVTYDGWPLYTYVLDTRRHQDNGQNVALNGGYWWALTPAGRINRTPVPHGGGYVGS